MTKAIAVVLILLTIPRPAFTNWFQLGGFFEHWLHQGDCEYGLNDDSLVNFVDYSLFLNRGFDVNLIADIDFLNQKNRVNGDDLTFARPGTAINGDGSSVGNNVMRTEVVVTVATPVEYTFVPYYRAIGADSGHVYFSTGRRLYKSRGLGTDFEFMFDFGDSGGGSINSFHITEGGVLLAGIGKGGDPSGGVWRQVSNDSWVKVLEFEAPNAAPGVYSWAELNGRVFVGEYGLKNTPDNPRRVYMSEDDGQSWTKIHEPPNVDNQHLHHLVACVVNGQFRLYLSYGDGAPSAIFYLTDPNDGGDIWPATEVTLTLAMQPTGGVWIPELNAIIWGSDGGMEKGLIKHNLLDDSMEIVIRQNWNYVGTPDSHYYNFFSMKKIKDTFLAIGSHQSGGKEQSGVWASKDAINWVRIIRHTPTYYLTFGGAAGGLGPDGKVWVGDAGSSICFELPEKIATFQGALIERGSDNQYVTSLTSPEPTSYISVQEEANEIWTGAWPDGRSRKLSEKPDGNSITETHNCCISKTGPNYRFNIPDVFAGDQICLGLRLKGLIGDGNGNYMGFHNQARATLRVMLENLASGGQIATNTMSVYPYIDNWQWVTLTIQATEDYEPTKARVRIYLAVLATEEETAIFDIYIDGIMVEKAICPAEWHSSISDRAADVLSLAQTEFPSSFTDVFTVVSRFGDFDMNAGSNGDSNSYIYLRSYAEDDDNFLAVVYDVYDRKVKLVSELSGNQSVLAESSAINFFRNESITIGIIKTEDFSTKLLVWLGGTYEAIDGTDGVSHTLGKSYWGCDPAGKQGGSLVFVISKMWNEAKSKEDTKSQMQWPRPKSYIY